MILEVCSCCWLKRSTAVSFFCSVSKESMRVDSCVSGFSWSSSVSIASSAYGF